MNKRKPIVAVIGAGPAGLFAAQSLVKQGARVVLLNRDIKPGGLAEYGIYYDKYKIKEGLRKQFRKILSSPQVAYYGNVRVAQDGDITLPCLQALGFAALVVAVGAQGTKWLGLPGEDLEGVYHAKTLLYHYNQLPPFSEQAFAIGRRVALIGVGNVMADIAHWLVRDVKVDEVVAVARRGPAEVKFTKREMAYVARNFDLDAIDAEIDRVAGRMRAVGQDPEAAKDFIVSALSDRALPRVSETRVWFRFLSAPRRIVGDAEGRVTGLEVDNTKLILQEGHTRPRRLGTQYVLDVDTVVFCIGDKVSEDFGLPVAWNEFVKCPEPRYPVAGNCYEAYDPEAAAPIEGVFVTGWARKASEGQVGLARKDAYNCIEAVMQYVESASPSPADDAQAQLEARLRQLDKVIVRKADWQRLEAVEQQKAEALGVEVFKFKNNEDMLRAIASVD